MKIDLNLEEYLIDKIDKNTKLNLVWRSLWIIYSYFYYNLPQFCKRMYCHYKGCKVRGGWGGFNLPPEAYDYWCERCGASESNYDITTTYSIIRRK